MTLSPTTAVLADRFRRAKTADVPILRAFFGQQLDGGEDKFDALNPFTRPIIGVCFPLADVWIAVVKRKVVAAGWFYLLDNGPVQVVALTHPDWDKLTDPLLAYIEAALQVIAHDQRVPLTQIAAWLPDGEHGSRLAAVYTRRGWTFTVSPWVALFHGVELRHEVLLQILEDAEASGVLVQAQTTLASSADPVLKDEIEFLRHFQHVDQPYGAWHQGRVVALNGVGIQEGHGEVAMTSAHWIIEKSPQHDLIERALLAAVLLDRATLPDLLIGMGDA